MYKIQRVLILIFAAVTCLASTNCRHVKKNRIMKLDICQACTELLNETVTKALEDIKLFSKCIEDNCDSAPILDGSTRKIKAKDEMFSSLPTFIHQIKIIQNAWEQHKLPSCPQNLEKYLTRILCLSRGASKKQKSCLARDRVKGPKADPGATIDYTGNYIRKENLNNQEAVTVDFSLHVGFCVAHAMTTVMPYHGRQEFNICRERSKLLQEETEKIVVYLRASSRCLEINHDMSEILPVSRDIEFATTTRSELLAKVPRFILELQLIREVWTVNIRRAHCLHNDLDKHLTRMLCLLKSERQNNHDCTLTNYFPVPSDYQATLTYAASFIREVYVNLKGLTSACMQ